MKCGLGWPFKVDHFHYVAAGPLDQLADVVVLATIVLFEVVVAEEHCFETLLLLWRRCHVEFVLGARGSRWDRFVPRAVRDGSCWRELQ